MLSKLLILSVSEFRKKFVDYSDSDSANVDDVVRFTDFAFCKLWFYAKQFTFLVHYSRHTECAIYYHRLPIGLSVTQMDQPKMVECTTVFFYVMLTLVCLVFEK